MNEKEIKNDKFENLLRRAHPSEPSPLLKKRITAEAKKVWNQTPLEMPWHIPVMRLVASAAAAVIIISISNLVSDYTLQQRHSLYVRIIKEQVSDFEALLETPYRSFIRHPALLDRKPSINKVTALRDYTERVRQVLNEMQQHGAPNGQVPNGGGSHLFPVQPGSDYYS